MSSLRLKVFISAILFVFCATPLWAAATSLNVSLTILSKNTCRFDTNKATLPFGSLNPLSAVDITATVPMTVVCQGSSPLATFIVSDNDGAHSSGPDANRMLHATLANTYLPYVLSYSPVSATVPKLVDQVLTVTGTILGADYQFLPAGNYSDTVILSINP